MNVSHRTSHGALVIDVNGDIDMEESPALRAVLFDAMKEGPKVALNLSEIRYIDSSGIAVLLEALRESQRLSRAFVLFGMSKAVHDVFKLTHVIKIFQVADTEEQALSA
ncbi:MAG: STAS domain-containing protein [Bryobacteraceae bacterium]